MMFIKLRICVFLLGLAVISNGNMTTEDCAAVGFNKANLMCSTCEKFDVALEAIKDHCKECCNKDEELKKLDKFARAILEVCTCKFGAYPQIQAFIKSDKPAKYPNLQIKYVRGLDPIVKLLDKDGNVQDTLSISKWDTDTVDEFLREHLVNDEDSDQDYLRTNHI